MIRVPWEIITSYRGGTEMSKKDAYVEKTKAYLEEQKAKLEVQEIE